MASFATGKWALRALSQSLAREFGPQGVHVSHAIIDGVIDIPRTKEWLKDMGPEAKLSADGVRFVIRLLTYVARSTNVTRLLTITGGCTLS
jgi:NAD(P)-dependent dehydrogenase (short-subunit alcohol dehydrogenase family)